MSAQRHHAPAGTYMSDDLLDDVEADIKAALAAQRDAESAGQTGQAREMGARVDGYLDERSQMQQGTWHPKHG